MATVIVLILRTFLFTPLMVKAASMNTILEDGKSVIVFKLANPKDLISKY
ncbi:S26 family signal peptidase [Rossellomorea aquimaris]